MSSRKTKSLRRLSPLNLQNKSRRLFSPDFQKSSIREGIGYMNYDDSLRRVALMNFCITMNSILLNNTLIASPSLFNLCEVCPEYTGKEDVFKKAIGESNCVSIEDIRDIDNFTQFINSVSIQHTLPQHLNNPEYIVKTNSDSIAKNNIEHITTENTYITKENIVGHESTQISNLQIPFNIENKFDLQKDTQLEIMKCLDNPKKKRKYRKTEEDDSEISLEINIEDKIIGMMNTTESEKNNLYNVLNKIKKHESKSCNSSTNMRLLSPSKWSFETSDRRISIEKESLEEKKKYDEVVSKSKIYKSVLVMNDFKDYDALIIKESRIHGLGIFTPVEIPANTLLMEYKGEIIGKCVSDKREKLYRKHNIDSVYMFSVSEDMIIDATLTGNKARYINHSCNPNCEAINSIFDKSIKYCTIRNIEVGEELTINYNMTQESIGEVCNCGHPKCRSNNK